MYSKFIKTTLIYTLLILGYIFLYFLDAESWFYEPKIEKSKSKIDFVYQQF
jgi:hypothetical protein